MGILKDNRKSVLLKVYIESNMDKDFFILSSKKDPFIITDLNGQFVYVNQKMEKLADYSHAGLLKMKLCTLFAPIGLDETQTFFHEKDVETLNNFDSEIFTSKGKKLDVNVTTFPIFFEGEYLGSYIVLKDVTHLKLKRNVIDKSESMKLSLISQKQAIAGQLAAGVAHEIRNPITAIKGFLQLIMRENEGNSVYLEIIDSEIKRIETILNELLVLAKPGKQRDECVKIRLLLEQVVTLMEPQALLNGIQIEKHFNHLHAEVRGDENQLKQVFINFIKNSIDAMPNGGKLLIQGRCTEENNVLINVIDQGSGIPQAIIKKVGDPFFTTKDNGTGLGMLVSNQIIHDHKGSMRIKSDCNGTCIDVNFPAIRNS
jgi:two-component system, sporulation sensor kinase A